MATPPLARDLLEKSVAEAIGKVLAGVPAAERETVAGELRAELATVLQQGTTGLPPVSDLIVRASLAAAIAAALPSKDP